MGIDDAGNHDLLEVSSHPSLSYGVDLLLVEQCHKQPSQQPERSS